MAEKVVLIDDLDASEGEDVSRREFRLLDKLFAIDLSEANNERLAEAVGLIELAIEKGREVKQAGRGRKPAEPSKLQGSPTPTSASGPGPRAWRFPRAGNCPKT